MKKKPKPPEFLSGKKIVVNPLPEQPDTDDLPPLFSFHHLKNPFCITNLNKDQKASFADRLRKISSLTWNDLRFAPKHGLGCEKISHTSLKAPIPKVFTPDETYLVFRLQDKVSTIIGVRRDQTLHVLIVDPTGKAYNHS